MTTLIKLLYSLEESQEITSIGRTKFLEFVRAGTIATVRVGRRRMVTAAALEEFVASLTGDEGAA